MNERYLILLNILHPDEIGMYDTLKKRFYIHSEKNSWDRFKNLSVGVKIVNKQEYFNIDDLIACLKDSYSVSCPCSVHEDCEHIKQIVEFLIMAKKAAQLNLEYIDLL